MAPNKLFNATVPPLAGPRGNAGVWHHKTMSSERAFSRWFRLSLVFVCGWLFVAALLLVQFWPAIPQTKAQWSLFVAFGPPLYFLAEFVGEKIFPPKRGSHIAPEGFSFKRVLVALPIALVFLAAVSGLVWLLTRY